MTYRSDIDGLRAVAVVLVVLFHIGMPGVTGGFVGVDVFFVISGFLITSIIKVEIEAGDFSLRRFYDRRIRRIVPALAVVYLFCIVVAAALLLPSALKDFGRSLLASILFLSNILFYLQSNYFAEPSFEKPLLHTWSLSVEEQFYLFWPLFLVVASRYCGLHGAKWLIAAGVVASLLLAEWQVTRDSAAAFYLIPARIWELGLGGLLALQLPDLGPSRQLRGLLSLGGLGLILYSAFSLTEQSAFPGLAALPACLGTAMVIVSGAGGGGGCNRLLSWPPMVFVGLVSYSLYLWHWPIIVFARYYLDREFRPLEAAAVVLLSLAAAVLSYRYVESPFRRSGRDFPQTTGLSRASPKRRVAGAVAVAVFCGAFGISMGLDGWSWRVPKNVLAVDRDSSLFDPYRQRCHGVEKALLDRQDCTIGAARADGGFDVAIMGDSHAEALVAAFDKKLAPLNLAGRQVTNSGCIPLFGVRVLNASGTERCSDFAATITAFLDRHQEIGTVVLASRWALYTETRWLASEGDARRFLVDERDQSLTLENSRRALSEGLERTVQALTDRGIKVVLMAQVPPLSSRRAHCVARARWWNEDEAPCYESAAAAFRRTAYADELIGRIAADHDDVEALFPATVLCDDAVCLPVLEGTFLFRDEDHLNPAGAERLLSQLEISFGG